MEGLVARNIFSHREDCAPELYGGSDSVESALDSFYGKRVKITSEEIKPIMEEPLDWD